MPDSEKRRHEKNARRLQSPKEERMCGGNGSLGYKSAMLHINMNDIISREVDPVIAVRYLSCCSFIIIIFIVAVSADY